MRHKRAKGEPKFKDTQVGILYDVTLNLHVEIAFDKQPTEEELREALLDNFFYMTEHVTPHADLLTPPYLSYEFVDAH
jgi:hypothetical protein